MVLDKSDEIFYPLDCKLVVSIDNMHVDFMISMITLHSQYYLQLSHILENKDNFTKVLDDGCLHHLETLLKSFSL